MAKLKALICIDNDGFVTFDFKLVMPRIVIWPNTEY